MRERSTARLPFGVVLPLFAASPTVMAGENDDVLKVIDDFCAPPRHKLRDAGLKASKLGFGAEYGQKKGPRPVHCAWLPELDTGSMLSFVAQNASEPVDECRLVSHVYDLADLIARLKAKFDLGEPKSSDASMMSIMKGQKSSDGKMYAVELVYGFEDNKLSGAFTFTTTR
jgi:hypothetical protein